MCCEWCTWIVVLGWGGAPVGGGRRLPDPLSSVHVGRGARRRGRCGLWARRYMIIPHLLILSVSYLYGHACSVCPLYSLLFIVCFVISHKVFVYLRIALTVVACPVRRVPGRLRSYKPEKVGKAGSGKKRPFPPDLDAEDAKV